MISQQNVIKAFYRLYQAYHNKRFTKSLNFTQKTERELLPLVRNYLLGYFDRLEPEGAAQITTNYRGRFDFLIDNVAVELAVRSKNKGENNLKAERNENEIRKLIRHSGYSLMILFDFKGLRSDVEVNKILKEYRNIPSLGRGNHHRYLFTVVYFYQDEYEELRYKSKRIQVKRRPISLNEDKDIVEQINFINRRDLLAQEYDHDSRERIHDRPYPVEVRIRDKELTIEYKYEGNYYQYKGVEINKNTYELISSENSANKAIVSLSLDQDNILIIKGTLIEDGYKKYWLIENE